MVLKPYFHRFPYSFKSTYGSNKLIMFQVSHNNRKCEPILSTLMSCLWWILHHDAKGKNKRRELQVFFLKYCKSASFLSILGFFRRFIHDFLPLNVCYTLIFRAKDEKWTKRVRPYILLRLCNNLLVQFFNEKANRLL